MQVHLQRSQTAGAEGQEVHGNHLNSASSQDSPLHILGVAELKNFPCGATSSHTPDLQQQGYWNCSSCPRSQVSNSVASSKKPPPGGGGGGGGGGGQEDQSLCLAPETAQFNMIVNSRTIICMCQILWSDWLVWYMTRK